MKNLKTIDMNEVISRYVDRTIDRTKIEEYFLTDEKMTIYENGKPFVIVSCFCNNKGKQSNDNVIIIIPEQSLKMLLAQSNQTLSDVLFIIDKGSVDAAYLRTSDPHSTGRSWIAPLPEYRLIDLPIGSDPIFKKDIAEKSQYEIDGPYSVYSFYDYEANNALPF